MDKRRAAAGWTFAGLLLLAATSEAQTKAPARAEAKTAPKAPAVVPIDQEPMHRLIFRNAAIRAFSVEVPPQAETRTHRHDLDYVFVTLGDSDVESIRVNEAPVRLRPRDGEVQFTKGGFAHKARNLSDKPFRNVTIELKKEGITGIGASGECHIRAEGMTGCEWIEKLRREPDPAAAHSLTVVRYVVEPGAAAHGMPKGRAVLVSLTESDARMTWSAAQPTQPVKLFAGGLLWMDWSGSPEQMLKNESAEPMRICLIYLPE
jgi:hypothetical protein